MRRTWNTSLSPTIGIVVAGTEKIGFGAACAPAGAPRAAAPVSASAPVASTVLRSTSFMTFSPVPPAFRTSKRPAVPRAFCDRVRRRLPFDIGRQLAAIGGELGHHLLVQPDVH